MPQRETKFAVNARPEELWKFIRDFESLCTCIPGVEKIQLLDDRTADVTVKEKVGIIPMILTLRARIESEEPPRRLHASAKAEHLTMAIDVSLERTASGTELRGLFDVTGTGQLKPIVDRLFEKRATERAAQFAECLEKRFSGAGEPLPEKKPAGPVHWSRRLWLWLAGLFRHPGP
jgi:carbon monoxide dehydrogenase subunit G